MIDDTARSQFDALTRVIGTAGLRRRALFALLGAAVLGHESAATLAKHKNKNKKDRPGKGRCLRLFELCSELSRSDDCCVGMECTQTITPLVTACQAPCRNDGDCDHKFPNGNLQCGLNPLICPVRLLTGQKCCFPKAV